MAKRVGEWRAVGAAVVWILGLAVAVAGPSPKTVKPSAPREAVALQFAAEADAVAAAIDAVAGKLRALDALRVRRVNAAMRLLHAEVRRDSTAEERMRVARRSAAARFLLSRDRAERRLLSDELAHLRSDASRVAAAAAEVATIDPPTQLAWPARGVIGRQFGEFIHERSNATLTRRGIDIVVEPNAPAVAPAAGVVRYAGAMRGLERGVILDHGSYLAIIAKLGEVTAAVGARVAQGETLGRAADHRVYLEVRVKVGAGGTPIDPLPLLNHSRYATR